MALDVTLKTPIDSRLIVGIEILQAVGSLKLMPIWGTSLSR